MGVPTPNQRNANSETENTPLLSSSSSRTENGDESEVLEGGSGRRRKGDGDSNQSVTGLRACFIIASLGVLIFLQGILMSFFFVWGFRLSLDGVGGWEVLMLGYECLGGY